MAGQQVGFRDVEDRLRELSAQGDPLEKLAATADFGMFRDDPAVALGPRDPARGGRPGFDPVLKFRMPALQAMHGLSLEQTECLPRDRLGWMRFCGLGPGDAVPDANTARGTSARGCSRPECWRGCSRASTGRSLRRAIWR
jgi:transposase, IS5 family